MFLIRRCAYLALLFLTVPLLGLDVPAPASSVPSDDPFLDPAFQNYAETTDGYLNPRYAPGAARDFRDSPSSFTEARPSALAPAAAQLRG